MPEISNGRRLFIAISVEGELKEAILAWQADHFSWPVRWLSGDNLHITVVAPWVEANLDSVIGQLESFAQKPRVPFYLRFFKVVFGPNRFAPRLVWSEGRAIKPILDLKDDLEAALGRPDPRFYRLHLTLARFQQTDFGPAGLPNLFDRVDWGQEVRGFTLYESILKPEGAGSAGSRQAEYIKIKDFNFS